MFRTLLGFDSPSGRDLEAGLTSDRRPFFFKLYGQLRSASNGTGQLPTLHPRKRHDTVPSTRYPTIIHFLVGALASCGRFHAPGPTKVVGNRGDWCQYGHLESARADLGGQ